jgi:hypothetical protein
MYLSVYKMYIDSFVDQMIELRNNYSLMWASTEINYLIGAFYNVRPFSRFEKRDLLGNVLRKAKCNAVDDGEEIYLTSIDDMPDTICTLDSRAFTSAVSLLRDMKSVDKTANGLLSELEGKELVKEPILLHNSLANCNYDLFLEDYEVNIIHADESARKIIFMWKRSSGSWRHINMSRGRSFSHLFVLLNSDDINVEGLQDKVSILSGRCVFLINESPLLSFFRKLIVECKVDEDVLEIISDLVSQILIDRTAVDDKAIDRFLNSEDNYLNKSLFNLFSVDELKVALKGCKETVLDINKYYRYYD